MTRGGDAGDHRRVVGPRHRGIDRHQRVHARPLRRQRAQMRDRQRRVGERVGREPVEADERHVTAVRAPLLAPPRRRSAIAAPDSATRAASSAASVDRRPAWISNRLHDIASPLEP